MFVEQVSVFLENKKGRLDQVLETLKKENVNILSLSLADTTDYGLLRMIVSDPENARKTLKENGFSAKLTQVLAVDVANKVGQLQTVLSELFKAGINVEYMYALATSSDHASIVIKTADLEQAAEILRKAGANLINPDLGQE